MLTQADGRDQTGIAASTSPSRTRYPSAIHEASSAKRCTSNACPQRRRRGGAQGVQVNAIVTNFMDFLRAHRAEDPEGRARVESVVPMGRLGMMAELGSDALARLGSRGSAGAGMDAQ